MSSPSQVNPTAEQGFSAAAGEYERARPDYPADAVEHLRSALGAAPGARVLDLACGTGKMTRLLRPCGAWLAGLDPVGAMLHQFRRAVPDVPVSSGTAERQPFRDGSFDAVVAAQAFHWFDGDAALAEIARVLKPRGALGLVWNVRDESVPWVRKMDEVFRDYENKTPAEVLRFWRGAWREAFRRTTQFEPLDRRDFAHVQTLTRQGVVERVLSVSFIAVLPPEERTAVADRVLEIVDRDERTRGKETIELPYIVQVYTTRRTA